MAIRRVLVLNKSAATLTGGCRRPSPSALRASGAETSTRLRPRNPTKKHENKATTGGASPLNRLAYAPRIPSR